MRRQVQLRRPATSDVAVTVATLTPVAASEAHSWPRALPPTDAPPRLDEASAGGRVIEQARTTTSGDLAQGRARLRAPPRGGGLRAPAPRRAPGLARAGPRRADDLPRRRPVGQGPPRLPAFAAGRLRRGFRRGLRPARRARRRGPARRAGGESLRARLAGRDLPAEFAADRPRAAPRARGHRLRTARQRLRAARPRTPKASEWAPAFSADGRWLAFLSDGDGDSDVQLWRMAGNGAAPRVAPDGFDARIATTPGRNARASTWPRAWPCAVSRSAAPTRACLSRRASRRASPNTRRTAPVTRT